MNGFSLLNPWGLTALASLGVVTVIYLFHQRYHPRHITGLFLWGIQAVVYRGGRNPDRLRLTRSFLLDLLACALLALAFAIPAITARIGNARVVILDASLSMRAGSNHARARAEALALLEEKDLQRRILIISAGTTPDLIADSESAAGELRTAIEKYDPFDNADSITKAIVLARELVSGPIDIQIFTDHQITPSPPAQARITTHVFAGKDANVALHESLRVRRYPAGGEALHLAIVNHAEFEQAIALSVTADSENLHSETLSLAPGVLQHLTLVLPELTGELTVRIAAKGDLLDSDSEATLQPEPYLRPTYRLALSSPATTAPLAQALQAAGAVPVLANPDILVTSGATDSGRVMTLQIHESPREAGALLGPYVIDVSNPLCQDLDLTGVYWPADTDFQAPSGAIPLIATGEHQLYWPAGDGRYLLNLEIARSNIIRSPAWPVLFANLVQVCQERLPGLHRANYSLGQVLEYLPQEPAELTPDRLEGRGDTIRLNPSRATVLPKHPGTYALMAKDEVLHKLSVNACAPGESNLLGLADADAINTYADDTGGESPTAPLSLGWLMFILAAAAVALNWFLDKKSGD